MPDTIEDIYPILTVKLDDFSVPEGSDPNLELRLKIQEKGAQSLRIQAGDKDVWLYQQPWPFPKSYTRLRFALSEGEQTFADGQYEQFTRIRIKDYHAPPSRGHHSTHAVIIYPYGEASPLSELTLNLTWYVTTNVMDLVRHTCQEMERLAESYSMQLLHKLDRATKSRAPHHLSESMDVPAFLMPTVSLKTTLNCLKRACFAWLMGPGGGWDHKGYLLDMFGTWSLDAEKGKWYSFEVWPSIIYGYLGAAAGLSVNDLLTETGIESTVRGLMDLGMMNIIEHLAQGNDLHALQRLENNQPLMMQLLSLDERLRKGMLVGRPVVRDQAGVRLGIRLWKAQHNGSTPTEIELLKRLRLSEVEKKDAPEGLPPVAFRRKNNDYAAFDF
ncbi:MAG: hypothetical protein AAGN35_12990 [Bacteroidota bacterium]